VRERLPQLRPRGPHGAGDRRRPRLGNAIALALAHAGADVALGLRDPATGADLADQIKAMGRRVPRLPMDVRHLDQVRAAVTATVGELGRLDILVNNAGLGPPIRPRTPPRPTST
jgi:NAD(P)-dependent dehydrogenase (short-subunit alcohol dehydrogenase family)